MKILHATALGLLSTPLAAQAFADDFNADTSGLYNIAQTADAVATFAFDYSALGIPSAPSTTDGSTLGLKLEANVASIAANAITLHTLVTMTGTYVVKFDAWVNANGPFPGGGTGSTEYLTCGVGGDGSTVNRGGATGSGGWFAADGEGGSTRDYRGYKNTGEQFAESGQFAAGLSSVSGGAHNNSDPYYAAFGGVDVGALPQGALFAQQNGTTAVGSFGFAWHQVEMRVVANGGTGGATSVGWYIDGLRVATLDAGIGSTFSTDGSVTLGYMDIFTSVSDNSTLSFGLIDNLVIGTLAQANAFGAGCAGTGGTPDLTANNSPSLGTTFQMAAANLDASTPIEIMIAGFSDTSGPLGPLPIDLSAIGFGAGCSLLVGNDVLFPFFGTGGSGTFDLPLPQNAQFLGYQLYFQVCSFDSTAAGSLVFSNGLATVLGL